MNTDPNLAALDCALADLPPDVRKSVDLAIAMLCRTIDTQRQMLTEMQARLTAQEVEIEALRAELVQSEVVIRRLRAAKDMMF